MIDFLIDSSESSESSESSKASASVRRLSICLYLFHFLPTILPEPKLKLRMSKSARGIVKKQRRMSHTARLAMKMFRAVNMS